MSEPHSEYRAFGPPGTGKTEWLSRQIDRASTKFGGVKRLLVASFTKAATRELSARAWIKPGQAFGTLHSICYQLHGHPKVAESMTKDWNEWIKKSKHPAFILSNTTKQDEPSWNQSGNTKGDDMMHELQLLRARMISPDMWKPEVRTFNELWSHWKDECGIMDFTDMIELTYREGLGPPKGVRCGFFDEVQDFTTLQLTLIRQWAKDLEYIVLVGDDDQCLYDFSGATPDAFLDPPIDNDRKTVLKQSYRIPRIVHEYSSRWIERVSRREPKEYAPKDEEGEIIHKTGITWKRPHSMLAAVSRDIESDKTVMILTACGYQLVPTLNLFRNAGIPFHNPYGRKRGDWNPIAPRKGITATERLLAFMRPSKHVWGEGSRSWTNDDLHKWVDVIKAGDLLRRGAKKEIAEAAEHRPEDTAALMKWFTSEAAERLLSAPDPAWFIDNVMASRSRPFSFPINILDRYGKTALTEEPKLIIGTIHSVKGGEADIVYVFPDLSSGGMNEWRNKKTRDPIIRMFYVAFTRTKNKLVLCGRTGTASIEF